MGSSGVLVVQSTIVTASIVRGSPPSPITISLLLARSWAPAGAAASRARASEAARAALRPRIRISFSLRSDPELGVEAVAQPVAQQVDAERGQRERGAGERGEPPRDVQEVAALREHAAPGRCGRLDAEAEEADRRLGHDE